MATNQVGIEKAPEKLTKRDIFKAWLRWMLSVDLAVSWERLQTLAFCACLAPILKKLYTRKEDLAAALKRHLIFYNSEGLIGSVIHGTVIAMEEQRANGADISDEAIIGLKTGMMGPFAGIGDTINWATIRPIILSIFLPMAAKGDAGATLAAFLILGIFYSVEGYICWTLGYRLGRQSILTVLEGGWIKQLISGAAVVGMFMMGTMSSQFVKFSTTVSWVAGPNTVTLQKTLDSLLPGLLPLLLIFGIYWYLEKKGPKYTTILLSVLGISLIGSLLKVL